MGSIDKLIKKCVNLKEAIAYLLFPFQIFHFFTFPLTLSPSHLSLHLSSLSFSCLSVFFFYKKLALHASWSLLEVTRPENDLNSLSIHVKWSKFLGKSPPVCPLSFAAFLHSNFQTYSSNLCVFILFKHGTPQILSFFSIVCPQTEIHNQQANPVT